MEDFSCGEWGMSGAVERYLAGTLREPELGKFEEHLVTCADCRDEVRLAAAVRESFELDGTPGLSVQPHDQGMSWRIAWIAAGLAAAAIGGLLYLTPLEDRASPTAVPVQREGPGADVDALVEFDPVRPVAGEVLEQTGLTLEWRAASPSALYRVTLTDANGDLIWQDSTRDTLLSIPAGKVSAGQYFWYVDARLPDGRTATTRAQTFKVE
ncbi:MAG: zf-HC2 domain-containing protein [marine benthic group bacterium]|jgi:hypothetical protein|nr:zf-HC2 domain-containing protein [Candidatus Benthicola marisminoris]